MKKTLSSRQVFERSISEEDVFGAIRALLELNGARVHRITERIPWGPKGRKSEPGNPDIHGWWSLDKSGPLMHLGFGAPWALHFYIETKRPGGKHRPSQIAWIEEAQRDGVIAFFADSVESMVAGFAEYGIKIKGLQ